MFIKKEFKLEKLNVIGTEARVCQDIASRQQLGIKKYGTTVRENPLTLKEWLTHAYEEVLDQAVYLKRAIEEIEDKETCEDCTDKSNTNGFVMCGTCIRSTTLQDHYRLDQ